MTFNSQQREKKEVRIPMAALLTVTKTLQATRKPGQERLPTSKLTYPHARIVPEVNPLLILQDLSLQENVKDCLSLRTLHCELPGDKSPVQFSS